MNITIRDDWSVDMCPNSMVKELIPEMGQWFGGFLNTFEIMLVKSKQKRINALLHYYIYEVLEDKDKILKTLSIQEKDMYQLK